MEYRIEVKEAFTVIGIVKEFNSDTSLTGIPQFWCDYYHYGNGKYISGMFGICYDNNFDSKAFSYMIADCIEGKGEIPNSFTKKEIPAKTWAIFPIDGATLNVLLNINTENWSEWLLSKCREYEMDGNFNIEMYFDNDTNSEGYECEVWIPVMKQKEMMIPMIAPEHVKKEAQKKENENIKFRTYLKIHAKEEELDQQFLALHNELFEGYDCSKCRNCCKMYKGTIPAEDLERDAEKLKLSKEQFIDFFLQKNETTGDYVTKNKPCDFLDENGVCKLGENIPDNCKNYPYTNQPERLFSLYSVLEAVEVCPVAFEIYERLKGEYGFRWKR